MKYSLNPDWERILEEAAAPAMKALAAKRTQQYAELVKRHEGGDIEAVKAELVRIYAEDEGEISDPELTQHADAIVNGVTITFVT